MGSRDLPYRPNYAVPPGETLLETLEAMGMTQAEMAERTGRPKKTINEIIKGKAPITPETALQLEHVLGIPARFWNTLETNYREALAHQEEVLSLAADLEWMEQLPWKTMARWGWVKKCADKVSQAQALLDFFGVASPEAWQNLWTSPQAAFRQSSVFKSDMWTVAAWLRKGEIEAQRIHCMPYSAPGLRKALGEVRALTTASPEAFVPALQQLCSGAGVAVVFIPELPQCRISGATRWLTSEKALIQLSLRFKTDDHLWFTFFHEAGHILLHGKRDAFIDENGREGGDLEREANAFAANMLITPSKAYAALRSGRPSKAAVTQFAAELGIAPGIVVGRLQHEGVIPFNWFNGLKRHFQWSEPEGRDA